MARAADIPQAGEAFLADMASLSSTTYAPRDHKARCCSKTSPFLFKIQAWTEACQSPSRCTRRLDLTMPVLLPSGVKTSINSPSASACVVMTILRVILRLLPRQFGLSLGRVTSRAMQPPSSSPQPHFASSLPQRISQPKRLTLAIIKKLPKAELHCHLGLLRLCYYPRVKYIYRR